MAYRRPRLNLTVRGQTFCLGAETKIMGVLNVTPDSFSDGGCFMDAAAAACHALKMEREGASLVDIGGESSRPGSRPVSAREEIRRILPVIKRLSKTLRIPLSVDTYKTDVAHAALDAGVAVVNDVYGLRNNRPLARLIARYGAGVVLMHMRGTPAAMQRRPAYRNVLKDVMDFLKRSVHFALEHGISRSSIVVDPGFGFGKTVEHNLKILEGLEVFSSIQCPLLVGLSRKSFIGHLAAREAGGAGPLPADRLYGSLGAAALAIARGAHILRVHDVFPHKQMAVIIDSVISK